MKKDIKLTLIKTRDKNGREYYSTEYDPDNLKELSLALLADQELKELALMTASYILSMQDDPDIILKRMRDFALETKQTS